MSTNYPLAKEPQHNDIVHVTLSSLIQLNQVASSVTLWNSRIRSGKGGGYLSRAKGRGMEFDEVRPYMPGDDVRSLDWRVTARTGKTHTKLFREERERPVLLGIDLCESMFFATRGVFKSVQAMKLAALLAWKAHQNGDRVGGQLFGDSEYREIKPQNSKRTVLHLLKELSGFRKPPDISSEIHAPVTTRENALEAALARFYRHSRPGCSIVLISDFRQLNQACEYHLMRLAKHCDVILLLVVDPLEMQLPPKGRYRFSDGQRDVTVNTADDWTVKDYRQIFRQRSDYLRTLVLRNRMRFGLVRTTDDPVAILQSGVDTNQGEI